MEAFVIGGALVGTLASAFILEKAALEGLFFLLRAGRRARE